MSLQCRTGTRGRAETLGRGQGRGCPHVPPMERWDLGKGWDLGNGPGQGCPHVPELEDRDPGTGTLGTGQDATVPTSLH